MQLLFITEFFPQNDQLEFTGGVEVRTYYLYQQLVKQHKVSVISRSPKKVSASFASLFDRLIFVIRATIEGLRSNAELVEASNFVTYIPAFIIGSINRIPKIAWYPDVFIGSWIEKFGWVGIIGELVERITLKLPWDHIIALSEQTKTKLIQAGVPEDKITVVYGGIDQKEFRAVKTHKNSTPTICCISRLVSYKRINDLLKAYELVKKKVPQAKLILIGTGPDAKNLNLESIDWYKQVTRSDLITTLKQSDVFCLPSTVEGFGLVTLEALAAGIPYVNADIPINREITQGSQGGLLFEPKNPQDLSDKILQLLVNKNLYHAKVLEGQLLLKNYSWEKSAQETEHIYQRMLG